MITLDNLLERFPDFLDKSNTSNFFKSQSVTHNQIFSAQQSILNLVESFQLEKRCCIWKEQNIEYDYSIHFLANYPNLKSVKCYKNEYLLYMQEYTIDEKQDNFKYIYNGSTETTENPSSRQIIPQDKFKMRIETHDNRIIEKGFPENDEYQGNIYDHDESLDEIGALNNIPRKIYIQTTDYQHTEPFYNDRLSEDDYHYMKRIIEYNLRLHNTPLPILEIWKLYGLDATMLNRERYLLKVFDEERHPFDTDTEYVQEWTPTDWEHKDGFGTLCEIDDGKYFFVTSNTNFPAKGTGCTIYFKILNDLAEELDENFTVDIALNNEIIETDYNKKSYDITAEILNEFEPNYFTVSCYQQEELIGTVTVEINIQGCANADIYVDSEGDDTTGTGSTINPYKTLDRAMQDLSDVKTIIAVRGTVSSTKTILINNNCTIIGCNNGTVENNISPVIFDIVGNKKLKIALVDIQLKYGSAVEYINNANYINENKQFSKYVSVIVHGGNPTLEVTFDKEAYYYVYDNLVLTGTFKSKTVPIPNADLTIRFLGQDINVTTDSNGEFTKTIPLRNITSGIYDMDIIFDGGEYHYPVTITQTVTINKASEIINNAYGGQVTLAADGFTPGESVKLYCDGNLIDTTIANASGEISYDYTPGYGSVSVYTSQNGINVDYEWLIQTSLEISDLPFTYFITDISIDPTSTEATITKTPLTDFSTVSDLEEVILDMRVEDNGDIFIYKFKSNYDDETILEGDNLYSKDVDDLLQAIQTLTITEDTDLIATYGVDDS